MTNTPSVKPWLRALLYGAETIYGADHLDVMEKETRERMDLKVLRALEKVLDEWENELIAKRKDLKVLKKTFGSQFDSTSCSQCGQSFGPGNSGFSRCDCHPRRSP